MPSVNLRPNSHNNGDFMSVDLEASPAEEGDEAGLIINVTDNNGHELAIFETEADAIREFRDMVVAECDKALGYVG